MRSTARLVFLFLLAAGCGSNGTTSAALAPPQQATLTVDWSIDGRTDEASCARLGIATIEVVVSRDSGDPVGTFTQNCEAFAISIPLSDGAYSATVTPRDPYGVGRATPTPIDTFRLQNSDELKVPVELSTNTLE